MALRSFAALLAVSWLPTLTPCRAAGPDDLLTSPIVLIQAQGASLATNVHVADLDGDGHLDLLVKSGGSEFTAQLGAGDGTFATSQVGATPSPLSASDVVDVDGDGVLDLVITHASTFTTFLGAGDGTFVQGQTSAALQTALITNLLFGDVDGDGDTDVVMSQSSQARFSYFEGAGDGTFGAAVEFLAPSGGRASRLVDVDGDPHVDLLIELAATVGSMAGNGDGTFAPFVELLDDAVLVFDVPDVTGTGSFDIISRNAAVEVAIDTWTAGAGFTAHVPLPEIALVRATADLDDDGLLDLVGVSPGSLVTLIQEPDGAFTPRGPYGAVSTLAAAGDFDEDGAGDVLVTLYTGASLGVQALVWHGGFADGELDDALAAAGFDDAAAFIRDSAAADFDGDGAVDFVAAMGASTVAGGRVLFGEPAGRLTSPGLPVDLGGPTFRIHAADLTDDGVPDLFALQDDLDVAVTVAVSAGDGTFAPPQTQGLLGQPLDAALGHVDADGRLDAAVLSLQDGTPATGRVELFTANGTGGWNALPPLSVHAEAKRVALGDLDEDGLTDVVVYAHAEITEDSVLQVYLATGIGTFAPPTELPTPHEWPHPLGIGFAPPLLVADLDGDQHLDLLSGEVGGMRVFYGVGDGTFEAVSSLPLGDDPVTAVVTDLDRDAWPDLVVTTRVFTLWPYHLLVLRGLGARNFEVAHATDLVPTVTAPTPADIDGDGWLDIVIGLQPDVWVHLNTLGPWQSVGPSLPGAAGFSGLRGHGTLQPGDDVTLRVLSAIPNAPAFLVIGASALFAPVKGGTLVPELDLFLALGNTDADGQQVLAGAWPPTLPPGLTLWFQAWFTDPGATHGWSATRGLSATTP